MKTFRCLALLVFATCLAPLTEAGPGRGGSKGGSRSLMGLYSFHLTPVVSFAPFYSGGGRDSGVLTAPRQDILRVGTFSADGAGNVTGHTIATTDDGATTVVIDFTFSGTYTLNSDGTGSLTISSVTVDDTSCTPAQPAGDCATFEGPETYAFVINNHGSSKLVSLIQTDNEGGGAKVFLTGEARRK
jgi:hypothetical protein